MIFSRKQTRWTAIALIAASAAFTATPGFAMPPYDGMWSVSIVTTKGDCPASYRYPMLIDHGVLANGGAIAINVSGRVASSGAVKVVVSTGDKSATGYGRLTGNAGSGSWKAASCSGSWTAARRNS